MQGPPASGKSTLANEIFNSNPKKYVIVSRDSIRESRGQYWIPEQEDYISDIEEFEIRTALKHGLIPIIDATNLNSKTIDKWNKLAEEENAEIEYKPLYIPFKEALERDSKRDRPVGKNVLKRFYLNYYEKEFRKEVYTTIPYIQEHDKSRENAVIVDLDGTVAFHNGRGPFEWDKIQTDIPNNCLLKILDNLANESCVTVIFLTGRNKTETAYKETDKWLQEHCDFPWLLVMRDADDYRSSDISKKELYEKYVKGKYNVLAVFDDSIKCTKMWREQGLFTCQVGDFE